MKTFIPKADDTEKIWYIVNAEDKVLGRLASKVATILRGKHKPIYVPHADVGDYVIVINAAKVRLTGKKLEQKVYYAPIGLRVIQEEHTILNLLDIQLAIDLFHQIHL